MKKIIAASIFLLVVTLACAVPVRSVMTTTPTARPVPTLTPSATATPEADTAIVRQPSVNVRKSPDGDPTGKYIYAGQEVTILEIDGDWVRIKQPIGWVWAGCLEGSKKGCIAK